MKTQGQKQQVFQGWIATLSDGRMVWEVPSIPGEKSAWQKLIDMLYAENLKVTSLRIQRGVTLFALPKKLCTGYYMAYEKTMAIQSGNTTIRQGCGSVIGDKVFIHWIDNSGNIYLDIRDLKSERCHTTLRDEMS
jgi:hypothetical protein